MAIASDLAMAIDPVRLAERAGLTPDPWQADLLRSTDRQAILLCSRQSGKSTTSAAIATHQAVFVPGSLVLVLSPSLRQSQELFRKCLSIYGALGETAPATAETKLTLELANGSRLIALPGKEATVRGFSGVALLLVDEASRVPDALYQAIRPMLAVSGGRIVLLSTPFGKRGFFWTEWDAGGADWRRVKVTAADCPRIPRAWLERERRQIGDWWYRQEYACEFMEAEDQLFAFDDIAAAFDPGLTPLFGGSADA